MIIAFFAFFIVSMLSSDGQNKFDATSLDSTTSMVIAFAKFDYYVDSYMTLVETRKV
jgi:hypothetical protein